MEADKDFLKIPGHDNSEPESTLTILPSGVTSDINLGSLGEVPDNMAVTVDTAGLETHMKVDGEYSSSQQTIMPENFVLLETSKGLILSVADANTDSINFSGTCIASVADEQGRPIITTSLPGTIFTQIQPVGVMEDQAGGVYGTVGSGTNTITSAPVPVFVDPDTTLNITEPNTYPQPPPDEGVSPQKKKKGGGWPKGKKRKTTPDVQAPRKPMTGYVIFAVRRRKEIRAKNPELHFAEVTKILGQEWSSLSDPDKCEYLRLAEEDKQRYITEMEEFQNSELYQSYLKSKKINPLIDLEENMGVNELHCKVCNQYFISSHNKKEHMFGRMHLQNIKNEIQKDLEHQQQQASLLAASAIETVHPPPPSIQAAPGYGMGTAPVTTVTSPPKTSSSSLDVNDFIMEFMVKNSERDQEIKLLRKDRAHFEQENMEITKQIKEFEEYETKLDQDLGNLKAYGASLSVQIDALKMVPTLFGVINF